MVCVGTGIAITGVPRMDRPSERWQITYANKAVAGGLSVDVRTPGGFSMRLLRRLSIPASESQMAVALCLCAVSMGLMLWMIMWQTDVIVYQRDVIRWMWTSRFGG